MWRRMSFQILFIALATALSGEVRVTPFGWDFRFGLGSSTFLLLLLLTRKRVPFIVTGFVTGFVVALFRTWTSLILMEETANFFNIFMIHVPAMFYYFVFALGMSKVKESVYQSNLFYLATIAVVIDVGSNVVEIVVRSFLTGYHPISATGWLILLIVAIVRVLFVIGIYANVRLRELHTIHQEQEMRLEEMLQVSSNLYSESFYLKKMIDTIEDIAKKSYHLYRQLQEEKLDDYGQQSLQIAENIHEVKKDAQRVMAGLTKLYDMNIVNEMSLREIIHFAVKGNEQYSRWLGKAVQFHVDQKIDYLTMHFLPLLTILNNLVANGVEAIGEKGAVTIQLVEKDQYTFIVIQDTGEGIEKRDLPLIFEAGFTTKFNETGVASTGIGLSHVRNIVRMFNGEMEVASDGNGTKMIIRLPTNQMKKGG